MNRKISLGAAISFMAVIAAITFTITMIITLNMFNDKVFNVKEREELYKKISEVEHLIRQNYVGEIDETRLLNSVSDGFADGIDDPYATYYDAETYNRLVAIEKGKLVGIGAALSRDDSGYLRISEVYEGSPAESAEIQENDLLIAIEGEDVQTVEYADALNKLMGEAGTSVNITVRRDSVDMDISVLLKNFEIPLVTMDVSNGNAYIRIKDFSDSAVEQFRRIISSVAADETITGIVFDVRGVNSGTLENACEMLDLLLPAGDIASITKNDGTSEVLKYSDANELNLPMVTLVNGKTQFAAELFAADLRDYNKSKLVGTTTYGQGVVPEAYQLKDGSCLVLSSAYFNSAVSENFNGTGLVPDYEVTFSAEDEKLFSYDQLELLADEQYIKALEVLDSVK